MKLKKKELFFCPYFQIGKILTIAFYKYHCLFEPFDCPLKTGSSRTQLSWKAVLHFDEPFRLLSGGHVFLCHSEANATSGGSLRSVGQIIVFLPSCHPERPHYQHYLFRKYSAAWSKEASKENLNKISKFS